MGNPFKGGLVFVKKHPLSIVALIGGAILIFLILRNMGGGSGGGTVVTNSGPSDAQVASGLQLQLAQIGAGTQIQLGQLGLAGQAADIAGQIELGKIGLSGAMSQMAAQLQLGMAQIGAQSAAAASSANVQMAGIAATLQGQRDQLQTTYNLAQLQSGDQRYAWDQQVTLNAQNNLTSLASQQINAAVLHDQMTSQTNMFNAQLTANSNMFNSQLAAGIETARIQAGVQTAQIQGQNFTNALTFAQQAGNGSAFSTKQVLAQLGIHI